MQARYIQRGESIDFVPERDIAAGEIVIRNGLIGVARIPVKKGTLGSLALSGVFDARRFTGTLSVKVPSLPESCCSDSPPRVRNSTIPMSA